MSRKKTFKLDSGAEYTVGWDDGCVYFEGGVTHIEPRLLPLLIDYAWEQKIKGFEQLLKQSQEKEDGG